jgi:small subunit ribosomal protein S6
MRRYETFVIIDPDISQEQRAPVLERVNDLIAQQDGFLVYEDVWGERKLAYEIRKKERGFYVRFDYCGLAPLVNEIERFFRIDDRALKYMTVLLDKDVDLEKVKEEKAAAESQREPEPAPPETPAEEKTAELKQEEAAAGHEPEEVKVEAAAGQEPEEVKVEAEAKPEPQVEEEAQASDAAESAEETTPAEKKEEA